MDKKKFYDAIDMIDDDLIKEAEIKPEKLVKADTGTEDSEMTVSGVELYSSRIKWRRIAATAAMLVLVAGIGAVGYNVFRHRTPVVKEDTEIATEANNTDEVSTKESNDKNGAESETTSAQKSEKAAESVTSAANEKKDTDQTSKANTSEPTAETVVQVTAQQTENPTEVQKPTETQKPKTTSKTTAKTTTKTTTTKHTEPVTTTTKPVTTEKMDVFARLNELNYYSPTCDGLPEYVLNAPGDTEVFSFNFSSKWVWRNGSASNPVQKEAVLPDDLADYLKAHGEEIGMYPAQYSIPVPMQNYSFNAQYIRTNCYGGNVIYPQKKLITSRSELDSYIAEYWENVKNRWSGSYDDDEFIKAAAKYDDNWFSSHKLMLVVLETSSGSHRYNVTQVSGIGVTIERKLPQVGTCDMAEWHILIEVDKDVYVNSDFMISTYDTNVQDNWLP